MIYKNADIQILRAGGKMLAAILAEITAAVRAGVTTLQLDELAKRLIKEAEGEPSFLNYRSSFSATAFPSALCTSINNEVVHAPAEPARILREGDIIGLDIGMRYPAGVGLCTDMAATVGVGKISPEAERLISITREALDEGIAAARAGGKIRDISKAVQAHVEAAGFSIVRDLIGHGVGKNVHEKPEVPNFVVAGPIGDYKLRRGLVIAIEPMVTAGKYEVETGADGWTVTSRDRSLAAHFEHTIVIGKNGAEILTQA